MQITTKATDQMSLGEAMGHVNDAVEANITHGNRYRVGVDANGSIVLAIGTEGMQRCDIGFTLSQVCEPS